MGSLPKRTILERRSSLLVTDPADRNPEGWELLKKSLTTLRSEVGTDGKPHWFPDFTAMLWERLADGSEVLRLPADVSQPLLQGAFPYHETRVVSGHWDIRDVNVSFRDEAYAPRDHAQEQIIAFMGRTGPYAETPAHGTDLIVAATSAGKSFCVIKHWTTVGGVLGATFAASMHLRTFKEELLKFTDLDESRILIVEGVDQMERAARTPEKWDVFLFMHPTIDSCLEKSITGTSIVGPLDAANLIRACGIGMMVYDECHLELRSVVRTGLILNIRDSFYLTATPARTKSDETRVLRAQVPYDRAFVAKKPTRLDARMCTYDTAMPEITQAKLVDKRRGYLRVYDYYTWLLHHRRDYFLGMIEHYVGAAVAEPGRSVAVVLSCDLKVLAAVTEHLEKAFPDKVVGEYSSNIDKKDRPAKLSSDIIVTTDKSFKASINPPIDEMILCVLLSSRPNVEQITGRLRDCECVLTDLYDKGFAKIVALAKARISLYKKLAKKLDAEAENYKRVEEP